MSRYRGWDNEVKVGRAVEECDDAEETPSQKRRKFNIYHYTASSFTPLNHPNSSPPYLASTNIIGSIEQSNDIPKHNRHLQSRNCLVAEYLGFDEDTEPPSRFESDVGITSVTRNRVSCGGGGIQRNGTNATTKTTAARSKGKTMKRRIFYGLNITKTTTQSQQVVSKNKLGSESSEDTETPTQSTGKDVRANPVDISDVTQKKFNSFRYQALEAIRGLQDLSLPNGLSKHNDISILLTMTSLDAVRAKQGFGCIIYQGPSQANTNLNAVPQSDSSEYITNKTLQIKGTTFFARDDTAKPSVAVDNVRTLPLGHASKGNPPNFVQESRSLPRRDYITGHIHFQRNLFPPLTVYSSHSTNGHKPTSFISILTHTELLGPEAAAILLRSSPDIVPSTATDSWSHSGAFKSVHQSERIKNNLALSQDQIASQGLEYAPWSGSVASCVASFHSRQASAGFDAFEDTDDGLSDSDLLMLIANEEASKGKALCETSSSFHENLSGPPEIIPQTEGNRSDSGLGQREPRTMEKDNRDDWTFLEHDQKFLFLDFSNGPSPNPPVKPSSSTNRESHTFFNERPAATTCRRYELEKTANGCHSEEKRIPKLTPFDTPKLNDSFSRFADHKPVVRPPFPVQVRDRSPIIGLSSENLLRTCFRVGEALNVGRQAIRNGKPIIIELYARVASSWREPESIKQHFVFSDLFHDHPPVMNGVYELWKGIELWDYDSGRFLNSSKQNKICRCIGKMRRDGKKWKFVIFNIWEATWDDVDHVKGIVCA